MKSPVLLVVLLILADRCVVNVKAQDLNRIRLMCEENNVSFEHVLNRTQQFYQRNELALQNLKRSPHQYFKSSASGSDEYWTNFSNETRNYLQFLERCFHGDKQQLKTYKSFYEIIIHLMNFLSQSEDPITNYKSGWILYFGNNLPISDVTDLKDPSKIIRMILEFDESKCLDVSSLLLCWQQELRYYSFLNKFLIDAECKKMSEYAEQKAAAQISFVAHSSAISTFGLSIIMVASCLPVLVV